MKTKLTLTRREMDLLIAYIQATYPTGKLTLYGKMIESCLSQLLLKLSLANIIIKQKYQLSIDRPIGLGFLLHCTKKDNVISCSDTALIVNKVIGLIDQKAA